MFCLQTNPPYAIFGHSMGALVAYEMCVQIEARSRSDDWAWAKPQALYVCGMRAPSLCGPAHDPDQKNPTLSELDGSDFWAAPYLRSNAAQKSEPSSSDSVGFFWSGS